MQTTHIRALIITCLIIIFSQVPALAADYPSAERWELTMIGFRLEDDINPKPSGAIVATGSSSMRFWDHRIHEDLAPLTIISRGFGGSNMNDVLTYLDDLVLKHDPRAVMIYEGDNDVADGVPADTIVATFRETFSRIHAHNDDIRIYIVAVKPSLLRTAMWQEMSEVNRQLTALAETDERITFIDVATPMLKPDGTAREELFVKDGLHMNQQGYDVWRDTVAPLIIEREVRHEF